METLKPRLIIKPHRWLIGLVGLAAVLLVACGSAATATPTTPVATSPPTLDGSGSTVTPGQGQPTATPQATPESGAISARDSMTLVINYEPTTLSPFTTAGGDIADAITKDSLAEPLTWHSEADGEIVPTTATTGWEQLAGNRWRFSLREGVKFHNGEDWNAQAALPSLAFQSVGTNENSSFNRTGGFTAEAVDTYTLDIICDQDCPIFPNTSTILNFTAPEHYTNSTEEELAISPVSFSPYKLREWQGGISLTMEAYEDYVPAGDHFEFQKARVRDVTWLWRAEQTVATSMIQAGEADMAWEVGLDAVDVLPSEQIKFGGSGSVLAFHINTLWHPELKKKEVRQALAHAIDCEEIVDALYGGIPPCRGNIIFPGVIGATEENIAPYEYNPELAEQLLREADYDFTTEITISGRGDRLPKLTEVYEVVHSYLTAIGINATLNVVETAIWSELRACGIGAAVNEVLRAQGKEPGVDEPTLADMQSALDRGESPCPMADLLETVPGSPTRDFGQIANAYLNCVRPNSSVCDPSPGGLQEQLGPARAASGEERQQLLAAMADRLHDDVLFLPLFEPQITYGVNPKLNWEPRSDVRVRVNTMWFSP